MNAILSMVVLAVAAYAILVRLSPSEMRRWADYLNSRADAEDFHADRFKRYREQRQA